MSELAIDVRSLVKRFDDVVAVNGIDLQVPKGRCVGLLGPNGAGKTTTVEILEGLQEPTSGDVQVLGMRWRDQEDALRERIGMALQETRFHEKLTVYETVRLFRSFYKRGVSVEEAIRYVQLEEKQNAHVVKLSGGQRQRLAIAVALVSDPDILFLDEPTTGLDPQSRRSLWDVVERLKAKGRTVVLTTHYMEEAEVLCDDIVIVDHGKVVARGTPKELIASIGGEQVISVVTSVPLAEQSYSGVPGLKSCRVRGSSADLTVEDLAVAVPAVLTIIRDASATLVQLATRHATLDDVFLSLTGRSLRDDKEGQS